MSKYSVEYIEQKTIEYVDNNTCHIRMTSLRRVFQISISIFDDVMWRVVETAFWEGRMRLI